MAVNLRNTGKKLVGALNANGHHITFNTRQFVGDRDEKIISMYTICEGVKDPEKNKYTNVELFSSPSMLQVVMFLRDMWYQDNGWELPTDQEKWNKIRKEINKNG